jgi:membrane-bound serine protease (ClpP class)
MKRLFSYLAVFFITIFPATAQKVISIKIDGAISPGTAGYIDRAIKKSASENAECLIIHLNTPGGLLKSTRVIVSAILNSPVPVVVYVSPGGAHAGSAGVFIAMAAHLAAMAPGTNIGAAHPVSSGGQMDTVMNEKVTNDAMAFIRTIAERRSRNVEWAVQAVRNSVSITESEALKMNVINVVAANENQLLQEIDGKTVEVQDEKRTLNTKNSTVTALDMQWYEKLLQLISDPDIAYILFLLGFYGLLFELYSPGAIFPGVIGGISLILALYAMHTLPINYAAALLLVFGLILFILEIKITSHGMLAIGGVISLFLGSMMLIRTDEEWDITGISLGVIIPAVITTALFFLVIVTMGIRAQRLKTTTGIEGMQGQTGVTITALNPSGDVMVHGEIWNARSATGQSIPVGQKIRVVSLHNFTVVVEAVEN